MKTFTALLGTLVLLLGAAFPSMAQDQTITDIVVASTEAENPQFTILLQAVQAAGLGETLASEGPFTVFAPTDEAFTAALNALNITAEDLLSDTETLTDILLYHVVSGSVFSTDLTEGDVETLQGASVGVSLADGVTINDATVITPDIAASNGVIHVIDSVLLPPTPEEDMALDEEDMPMEPAAEGEFHLRVAHFSPDTPAVDVYVNGEVAIPDLAYPTVTDWISLAAGTYNIAVAPAGTSIDEAAIGPVDLTFQADEWVNIAAVGSLAEGTLAPAVFYEDYNTPIAEGRARLTVFHAIENAGPVDVMVGDDVLIDVLSYPGSLGDNDGAFTLDVPASVYGDLTVVPNNNPDAIILNLSGTELEANTFYLVAAIGTTTAPDVSVTAVSADMMMMDDDMGDDMAEEEDMAEGDDMSDEMMAETIVDIALADENFSILVAALEANDLVGTLAGEGPFTVFAPTNAAFEAAGITELPEDPTTLLPVLLYHVASGNVMAGDLTDGMEIVTLSDGATITVGIGEDGTVTLNDTVTVTMPDVIASNGVIHVIDSVLLPPTE